MKISTHSETSTIFETYLSTWICDQRIKKFSVCYGVYQYKVKLECQFGAWKVAVNIFLTSTQTDRHFRIYIISMSIDVTT